MKNTNPEEETRRSFGSNVESASVTAQIRSIKLELEALRLEKDDIEMRLSEQIRILESRLRAEKEIREEAENKLKQSEETTNKEKKEKNELKIQLQTEKEEKRIILERESEQKKIAFEREKEQESKLYEKEKERMNLQLNLQYENDSKKEISVNQEETVKTLKNQIERRRNIQDENNRFKWENDKYKRDNERLNKQIENEQNLTSEFETKYMSEIEENERMKNEFDMKYERMKNVYEEKIEQLKKDSEQRIKSELSRRIQSEKELREEQKKKQQSIELAEYAQKTIIELEQQLHNISNQALLQQEEINNEKEISQKEKIKSYESENKRKESDKQKQIFEEENWVLKRENEKIKNEVIRIKKKFGEEQYDQEVHLIEQKEKEKEEELNKLNEQIKWMKLPDDLLKKLVEDLMKPLEGTEIQRKEALQLLENDCKFLSLALNDRKDDDGRKRVIQSGVIEGFINVFENYELNIITRTYSLAFVNLINPSSDEIKLLIYNKKPYLGLIRLLKHPDDNIANDAIASILLILQAGTNATPESDPHPHYESIQESDGIKKIFALFQKNKSKYSRDRSALCIGYLFRAREIKDQIMRQEIIGHLKILLNDSDA